MLNCYTLFTLLNFTLRNVGGTFSTSNQECTEAIILIISVDVTHGLLSSHILIA